MFRPLALAIGLRYTRAKRRNQFISFISLASMLGIAVGVTALITVLSVMNGFEKEVRGRILSMVAHATISDYEGQFEGWSFALEQARQYPGVLAAAPYIEREALLQGRAVAGGMVRGIDPVAEAQVSEVARHLVAPAGLTLAALELGRYRVILGRELAFRLGVEVGDSVLVYAPQLRTTPAGVLPQVRRFEVVGLFEVGMFEYDSGMLLMHLADAQRLFRLGDAVTGVRLKLLDMFRAATVARELGAQFAGQYRVRDWAQMHGNLFRAVRTEKFMMFLILSLIVAVAAFNLVSTLVMVVNDKRSDIAILRTLGASPGLVMRVFIVQGLTIGLFGTLLGVVGGVLLATNLETLVPLLERALGFEAFPADIYYIDQLPSDLRWADVVRITTVSIVLCVLATLYPAWSASRTQPAEALRYE